jgi:predicted  nucleic acid-binding Zn-ribbon protein
MQNLIESLNKEKTTNEAKIKELKGQVWDLNVKNKAIDKAIKALDTTKENQPGKAA